MSMNSSAVQLPVIPQQPQDTGLHPALQPGTPDVADLSEPGNTEPVLNNRAATNSSTLVTEDVNQLPISIDNHTAPEKSDRSSSASSEAVSANADDEITAMKKAALSGDAEAQCDLGLSYDSGDGVKEKKEKAFKWYCRAAEQGHTDAQYNLGLMYANGEGVKPNEKLAFDWFQKAADQGDPSAQFMLGQMYRSGRYVLKDKFKAAEWFEKSAGQGHPDAQFMLGQMYRRGIGVAKDKVKAVELWREAANQHHPLAQNSLALMYQFGKGVKKNQDEAITLFRRSAEQGCANAQYSLAEIHTMPKYALAAMYTNGEGVEKNSEKAFMWCQKAADQNHREAMKTLSNFYKEGQGVAKDLLLATFWMMKFLMASTGKQINFVGESELFEFVPNILENYPEFKYVKTLRFDLLKKSSVENIARIAKIIRSNPKIECIVLFYWKELDENSVDVIAEALKFNTNLTDLQCGCEKLPKETADQIERLLSRNRDIAELRQYVLDHPLVSTVDIPTDVINILDQQIIVSFIKSGQTKEATIKAIDEFLIIASTTALAKDSKLN